MHWAEWHFRAPAISACVSFRAFRSSFKRSINSHLNLIIAFQEETGKSKQRKVSIRKVDYILGRENEKVPTPATAEDGLDRNIVRILGRDGSRYEGIVSDSQRELFKQCL